MTVKTYTVEKPEPEATLVEAKLKDVKRLLELVLLDIDSSVNSSRHFLQEQGELDRFNNSISAAFTLTDLLEDIADMVNAMDNTEPVEAADEKPSINEILMKHGRGETKSRRLQLVVPNSLHEKLKAAAEENNTSVNNLIHCVLEEELPQ